MLLLLLLLLLCRVALQLLLEEAPAFASTANDRHARGALISGIAWFWRLLDALLSQVREEAGSEPCTASISSSVHGLICRSSITV
jgi:hypothetical protein